MALSFFFSLSILPKLSRRFATIDANRRSPAKSEIRKMYSGALTCELKNKTYLKALKPRLVDLLILNPEVDGSYPGIDNF